MSAGHLNDTTHHRPGRGPASFSKTPQLTFCSVCAAPVVLTARDGPKGRAACSPECLREKRRREGEAAVASRGNPRTCKRCGKVYDWTAVWRDRETLTCSPECRDAVMAEAVRKHNAAVSLRSARAAVAAARAALPPAVLALSSRRTGR